MLGEEHPRTLTAMNNLAATLYLQGDLKGARKLQEQVLAESRRVQGEEHPHTLTAMNNLAETLKALGDLAGTRKLQEQVLETRRRLLGEEHPDTLTAMKISLERCARRGIWRERGNFRNRRWRHAFVCLAKSIQAA